jgi:[ribosomal protein S5]-alanine N-acetyltransferase
VTDLTPRHPGPTVHIRPWTLEDAPGLAALYTAARDELALDEPWRAPEHFTVAGQRQRLAALIERAAAGCLAGFVILADGRLVGTTALADISRRHQSAVIGYWVAPPERRRGLARAAVRQVLAEAFGPLQLHRVQANIEPSNAASIQVALACGFERIGLAREYRHDGIRWRDFLLFQRLAGEATVVETGSSGPASASWTGADARPHADAPPWDAIAPLPWRRGRLGRRRPGVERTGRATGSPWEGGTRRPPRLVRSPSQRCSGA